MRYHWGLGVGHLHAHRSASTLGNVTKESDDTWNVQPLDGGPEEVPGEDDIQIDTQNCNSDVYDSDNSELGLDDRDLEGWEDVESDAEDGDGDQDMEDDLTMT
jgi:hypothetical protein